MAAMSLPRCRYILYQCFSVIVNDPDDVSLSVAQVVELFIRHGRDVRRRSGKAQTYNTATCIITKAHGCIGSKGGAINCSTCGIFGGGKRTFGCGADRPRFERAAATETANTGSAAVISKI